MTKKILITGANGYIGSALVKELAEKSLEIVCIDDFSRSSEKDFSKLEQECRGKSAKIVFENASVFDRKKILELLQGVETAVHLAFVHSVDECEKHSEESARINVEGTKKIIGACEKAGVKRLVFPSSILVYGNTEAEVLTEKTETMPLNNYARHKLECEKLCKESKLECIILRKANVFGLGFFQQFDTVIPIFVKKALSEKKIEVHGSGEQQKNFLHIRDAMQAYRKAIFSDYKGTLNIGGKEDVSINKLAQIISEKLECEIGHAPSPRKEPKNPKRIFSSEKAKKELGYEPKISLKTGIEELVEWFKKNGL